MNPKMIKGNWRAGWTLDLHTVSSLPLPDGGFDTKRSWLGERLYRAKYRNDRTVIRPIAELVAMFLKGLLVFPYLTAIIPIPPSDRSRPFQPVLDIASEVGRIVNLPAPLDYLRRTRETVPLKDLESSESRKEELRGALSVADRRYEGQYVLLLDDIYRSGETLAFATEALQNQGGVARVYVLALTRTRTKR